MYIIFEHQSGLLQIGLASLKDLGRTQGFFTAQESPSFEKMFVIEFHGILSLRKNAHTTKIKDYRMRIYSLKIRHIIAFLCSLFLKCQSLYRSKKAIALKKRAPLILFICFLLPLCFFFLKDILAAKKHLNKDRSFLALPASTKAPQSIDVEKRLLANAQFSLSEQDYENKLLPQINGIRDFYILPLLPPALEAVPQGLEDEKFGYLLVPFQKIYFYKNDHVVQHLFSQQKCVAQGLPYYIYKISSRTIMLIFSAQDKKSTLEKNHFYYFSQNALGAEKICSTMGGVFDAI